MTRLSVWAGSMAGSVLPRAGRRVGQETLPRATAGACTGSFMSGLLSSGPDGKRGADGLSRFAVPVVFGVLIVAMRAAKTLARTRAGRRNGVHPPAAVALS